MAWLDALLGKLLHNGTELELRGGLNFKGAGVTVSPSVAGYDIDIPGGGGEGGTAIQRTGDVLVRGANRALTGLGTIDGVALAPGMVVVPVDQTDGRQNGPWVAASIAWTRPDWWTSAVPIEPGTEIRITRGTAYTGAVASVANVSAVTVDTTAASFLVTPFADTTGQDGVVATVVSEATVLQKIGTAFMTAAGTAISRLDPGSGNEGKAVGVFGGVMAFITAGHTVKNELGATQTDRAILRASGGLEAADVASETVIRPVKRRPRALVRTVSTANVANPLISSNTINGVVHTARDVTWRAHQTTTSENGLYWLQTVAGAGSTWIKLSLLDACIADGGLYIKVCEGSANANTVWRTNGSGGSLAAAVSIEHASEMSFIRVNLSDYEVAADGITDYATGDNSPIVHRAIQSMAWCGGEIHEDHVRVRRFANQIIVRYSGIEINCHHAGATDPVTKRWVFDACGGFLVPYPGQTSAGATSAHRGTLTLKGCVAWGVNGSLDTHEFVRAHYPCTTEGCFGYQFYGKGISYNSTVDAAANINSGRILRVGMYETGLSAFHIQGGDANIIPLTDTSADDCGTREVVGDDWCFLNQSFLGCRFEGGKYKTVTGRGGIKDDGTFTLYLKPYTENNTPSDIGGTSLILGGNLTLRAGGTSTRLPQIVGNSSGPSISSFLVSGGSARYADAIETFSAGTETTGITRKYNASGGNQYSYTWGWNSTNQSQNLFITAPSHSLGAGQVGGFYGLWTGTGMRHHGGAAANLPSVGVPLVSGDFASVYAGPYGIKSKFWSNALGDGVLAWEVLTNSGAASYNLTWGVVAHPSEAKGTDLTDADQTLQATEGSWRRMVATTTSANRNKTLGTTGAKAGHQIEISVLAQGHDVAIINGGAGAGTLATVTAGQVRAVKYQFDGTNWLWRSG